MAKKEKLPVQVKNLPLDISHIGGINEQLGGVDPDIDNDLMRLAGGP